jgi:hypothetical protein
MSIRLNIQVIVSMPGHSTSREQPTPEHVEAQRHVGGLVVDLQEAVAKEDLRQRREGTGGVA